MRIFDISILKEKKTNVWDKVVIFFAFGFGTGFLRPAPGTWGTLPGLFIAYLIAPFSLFDIVFLMFFFLLGVYCCQHASKVLKTHDFGGIVIDEIVGVLVTLSIFEVNWLTLLLAFIWFRVFDIVKPWPIKWLDKQVKGGLGIMIDDVVAGVFAIPCVYICLLLLAPIS